MKTDSTENKMISFIRGRIFLAGAVIFPQLMLIPFSAASYLSLSKHSGSYFGTSAMILLQTLPASAALTMFFLIGSGRKNINFLKALCGTVLAVSGIIYLAIYYKFIIPEISSSIANIYTENHFLYFVSACTAPAVIYPLLILSLRKIESAGIRETLLFSLGGLTAAPLTAALFYGIRTFLAPGYGTDNLINLSFIAIITAGIIMTTAVFFRLSAMIIIKTERFRRIRNLIIRVFFFLLFPFAGLALNAIIPFPADFQKPEIYLLTLLNSALLLTPVPDNFRLRLGIFCARTAVFPFIVFMFIVFAPFLPFSFPGVMAAGVGFIVMSPAVLMFFHLNKMKNDFTFFSGFYGIKKSATAIFALIILLPLLYASGSGISAMALRSAYRYVLPENPAFAEKPPLPGYFLKKGMITAWSLKCGSVLPVIGRFDALFFPMLPDPKTSDKICRVFFDMPANSFLWKHMPKTNIFSIFSGNSFYSGFNFTSSQQNDSISVSEAEIISVDIISSEQIKDAVKTSVKITMKNPSNEKSNAEMRAGIKMPEGIFISGFKLKIADVFENGQIYEKNSAIKVFNQIVSRGKDPAIVYYTSDTSLCLRVFPFDKEEKRECIIEFTYPAGESKNIEFVFTTESESNQFTTTFKLQLNKTDDKSELLSLADGSGRIFYVPESVASLIKEEKREAVLAVIIDRSLSTKISPEHILSAVSEVMGCNSEISEGILCFSGADSSVSGIMPLDQLVNEISKSSIDRKYPKNGGFFYEKAVSQISQIFGDYPQKYPLFLVISESDSVENTDIIPVKISQFIPPDYSGIYIASSESGLTSKAVMHESGVKRVFFDNGKYSVFKGNNSSLVYSDEVTGGSLSFTLSNGKPMLLNSIPPEGEIESALQLFLTQKFSSGTDCMDKRPPDAACRGKRKILGKKSAYIVVENAEQRSELENKEAEEISGGGDIHNAPEPHLLILFFLSAGFIIIKERIRRVKIRQT